MRIVIAGAGKLGFSIAQLLAEDQFDVVVVEIDPKRKDVIQNTLDVLAIEGNSCNPTTFADPDIRISKGSRVAGVAFNRQYVQSILDDVLALGVDFYNYYIKLIFS